jgi:hypothetical protein
MIGTQAAKKGGNSELWLRQEKVGSMGRLDRLDRKEAVEEVWREPVCL